jgi:hypothetical protein
MTAISGWVGTGAGLIVIGACLIAVMFVNHLPKWAQPWAHRALIIGMYAGATAVLVTTLGQYALHWVTVIAGFFGGFGSGLGKAAIVLAGLFLLLTVAIGLWKVPDAAVATLAVALAFLLALTPGGILHQFYVTTAAPGQQLAATVASWLGG